MAFLVWGLPVLAAWWGDPILRVSRVWLPGRVERLALSIGTGIGLLGTVVSALGAGDVLTPRAAAAACAGLTWLGLRRGYPRAAEWRALAAEALRMRGAARALLALCAAGAGWAWAGASAPPTAHDALVYHLNDPVRFVEAGRIRRLPATDNSIYPYHGEMLFSAGLLLGGSPRMEVGSVGATLAHGISWTCGLCAALATYALARRWASRTASLAAAAVLLLTPGFLNEMAVAYVDGILAMHAALAVLAILRWADGGGRGAILLAGVHLGWAASVKYNGLAVVATGGALAVALAWRRPHLRRGLGIAMLLLSLGLSVAVPWYLRTWRATGNPVYPFAHRLFGAGYPRDIGKVGMGNSLPALVRVPWNVTMHPDDFDGAGNQVGPAYLLLLGGLALFPAWIRRAWPLAAAAAALGCAWFLTGQSARFLFPALPFLAALGVLPLAGAGRVPAALLGAVLAFEAGLAGYYQRDGARLLLGREPEAAYLARVERTHAIAPAVSSLPADARLLTVNEMRHLYLPRPAVEEALLVRYDGAYPERYEDADGVVGHLQGAGYTHILWRVREGDPPCVDPLRLPALLSDARFREAYLQELATTSHAYDPADRCRYHLFAIR